MYPEISKEIWEWLNHFLVSLEAVLCDPEGKGVMAGSQKDRDIVQKQLDNLTSFLECQMYYDFEDESTSSL